jgi:hypothetical protein
MGLFSSVSMWSLNPDLAFDGYFVTDTIFHRRDSVLTPTTWTPPYRLTVTYTEGCGVVGDIEEVHENVFRPRLYAEGETMDTSAYAPVEEVHVASKPVHYCSPLGAGYFNDSTELLDCWEYLQSCFVVPQDVPRYLGFAIQSNGVLRKGWLRFELQAYNKIAISAAAIEE